MTEKRKHIESATRIQQLINAADAVLLDVGVNDFTTDKVIAYLGIAKGTLYRYYATKDDLLADIGSKALKQLLNYFRLSERNAPDSIEKTKAVVMASYHYAQDYPKYFELLIHMERPDFETAMDSHKKASSEIQDFFMSHIQEQIDKGLIRKDVKPLLANYVCWGSSMGIMQFLDAKSAFLENTVAVSQQELFEAYVDMLIRGMQT